MHIFVEVNRRNHIIQNSKDKLDGLNQEIWDNGFTTEAREIYRTDDLIGEGRVQEALVEEWARIVVGL